MMDKELYGKLKINVIRSSINNISKRKFDRKRKNILYNKNFYYN